MPLYNEMTVGGFLYFICNARNIKGKDRKQSLDRIVPMCSIESVTVSSSDETYTLKTEGDGKSIILENFPQGKVMKESESENVFTALKNLRFEDVMGSSASEAGLTFNRKFICRLKNMHKKVPNTLLRILRTLLFQL